MKLYCKTQFGALYSALGLSAKKNHITSNLGCRFSIAIFPICLKFEAANPVKVPFIVWLVQFSWGKGEKYKYMLPHASFGIRPVNKGLI